MAPIGPAFPDTLTAGSALIQACEKAGSTVPRYVSGTSITIATLQLTVPLRYCYHEYDEPTILTP